MPQLDILIQDYGYWVVLLGTFLEGETILVLAGFAAHQGYLQLPWVVVAAVAGTLAGDQLFFFLGRRHSAWLMTLRPRWASRLDRGRELVHRYQTPLLLGFRFLYGLRTVIPFAIGLSRIPAARFAAFNAAGALVWAVAVGTGGYLFGQAVELVIGDLKRYEAAAMIAVLLLGGTGWLLFGVRRRRERKRTERERQAE